MKLIGTALFCLGFCLAAQATADGPDFYRVNGVAPGMMLDLRSEANPGAPVVRRIPADAQCLRNLGCRGGLSFEEFTTLPEPEKQRRQAANLRWCNVEYQGSSGWVEGRFLAEGTCPTGALLPNQRMVEVSPGLDTLALKGRIQGDDYMDYRVRVAAGQTLSVSIQASHPQHFFNVLPPGSAGEAMFIGSSAGSRFERIAPGDGVYVVRTYLMRAAARRNAGSHYEMRIGVTGEALKALPASQDALIPGTPFHASGSVICNVAMNPDLRRCEAYVIRRGIDGTATVEIRRSQGSMMLARRVLLLKGLPVSTDANSAFDWQRVGDELILRLGSDEEYRFPDALIVGG